MINDGKAIYSSKMNQNLKFLIEPLGISIIPPVGHYTTPISTSSITQVGLILKTKLKHEFFTENRMKLKYFTDVYFLVSYYIISPNFMMI